MASKQGVWPGAESPQSLKGPALTAASILDLWPPDWERMDVCNIAITFVGTFEGSRGQPTPGRSLSLHLTVLPELSYFTPRRAQLPAPDTPPPPRRPCSHPPGCSEGLRCASVLGTLPAPSPEGSEGLGADGNFLLTFRHGSLVGGLLRFPPPSSGPILNRIPNHQSVRPSAQLGSKALRRGWDADGGCLPTESGRPAAQQLYFPPHPLLNGHWCPQS